MTLSHACHASPRVWLHAEGHLAPHLARDARSRKNSPHHLDLGLRAITQLKDKVLNEYRQHSLSSLSPLLKTKTPSVLTLNSATAKFLPRQIRGPSENVSRCRCPCNSFALAGMPFWPLSSSQRLGRKTLASSPQMAVARLMEAIGTTTSVPLATVRVLTNSPDAVWTGLESGSTSSSRAYISRMSQHDCLDRR